MMFKINQHVLKSTKAFTLSNDEIPDIFVLQGPVKQWFFESESLRLNMLKVYNL